MVAWKYTQINQRNCSLLYVCKSINTGSKFNKYKSMLNSVVMYIKVLIFLINHLNPKQTVKIGSSYSAPPLPPTSLARKLVILTAFADEQKKPGKGKHLQG